MRISSIKVNHRADPIGIHPDALTVHWCITDAKGQTSFQLKLIPLFGKSYSSAKIKSEHGYHTVPSSVLQENMVYDLTLQVWDGAQETCIKIRKRFIITSLRKCFTARWIWSEKLYENQHLYLRSALPPAKDGLVAAIAHISADDYYKCSINETYVGEGPAVCPINSQNYNTWDITSFITPGEKAMFGIHAYYFGKKNYGKVSGNCLAGAIAEIHYIYTDHIECASATSELWEIRDSEAFISTHLMGYDTAFSENIDARKLFSGWDMSGAPSKGWRSAMKVGNTPWNLVPQETQPLEIYDVHPSKLEKVADGHYFLDFGKEYVGCLAVNAQGKAGDTFEVRMGEELNNDGTVRFDLRADCIYREHFTLSGSHDLFEQYEYKAFRYVEILSYPGELTPEDIKIIARYNPFPKGTQVFTSSDTMLNDVWELCEHGLKMCSQDLYVDCPTREKAQYPGDLYIAGYSSHIAAGEHLMQKKALDYYLSSFTDSGYVNTLCPAGFNRFDPEYACMLFPIAECYYMETGDLTSLLRWLPSLERIIHIWDDRFTKEGLIGNMLPPDSEDIQTMLIVDWPENFRDGFEFCEVNTVMNALYYNSLRTLSNLHQAVGNSNEVNEYTAQSEKLKTAMNNHLLAKDGLYYDGLGTTHNGFHANMYCLRFDVTPEELVDVQLQYLMGRGMVCGVYVAAFFLETLYKHGKSKYALDLMRAQDGNSWGSMLNAGATCCLEVWNPDQKWNVSWCHAWSGSPTYILPTRTIGIQPLKPGYEEILIAPQLGDLKNGKTILNTVKGAIEVSFTQTEQTISFEISIPAGAVCTFQWENQGIYQVSFDGKSFFSHNNCSINNVLAGRHSILLVKEGKHNAVTIADPA
jgi:alpha-L-rhamnosidase